MRFDYSTQHVASDQRLEYWHDSVCAHFVSCECRTGSTMEGQMHGQTLGTFLAAQYTTPHPHSWHRSYQDVRRDPDDGIIMIFIEAGSVGLTQSGRESTLHAGDISMYDAARPFVMSNPVSMMLLRMPRRLLLSRLAMAEHMTGSRIASDIPITGAIGTMLREAIALSGATPEAVRARLSTALLDTLTVVLELVSGVETTDRQSAQHTMLYNKAVRFVDANFDNYDLSVADIANALNISERTLLRLFAKQGLTPSQHLSHRRLEHSFMLLSERRVSQIAQAAYQSGFNDLSHFCRLFKKHFGHTPSHVLTG
ncbi:helix-turn-helix domain-containing protein [Paraburkholderia caffeinilytica]|uniref:helix-turn-helix domain-containing protein n=1 Tax=Paraburkholderia caffeinilytica TaxID=1761016 RepID=UPI003DA0A505